MSFIARILRPQAGSRKQTGAAAEDLAASFLTCQGLEVVERNYRVRGGEIDLICQEGTTLVFVEVRLRSNQHYGGAAASITTTKQRRLILAARHYLQTHGESDCRFDCVLLSSLEEANLEWLRDAFQAD
jgi:putative endonuclease